MCVYIPGNVVTFLNYFSTSSCNKKYQKGLTLIWHVIVWKIWEARNVVIFSSQNPEVEDIVDTIKLISWRLFLAREKGRSCLYFEWFFNPFLCFNSWFMNLFLGGSSTSCTLILILWISYSLYFSHYSNIFLC